MRRLIGKIALTAGGALLAGGLLVIAYVSGGAAILALLLSAVFLVGGSAVVSQQLFVPIIGVSLVVFALASWALASLGASTFWLWKRKKPNDPPGVDTQP